MEEEERKGAHYLCRSGCGKVWKGEDGTSGIAGADPYGMVPQGDEALRVRLEGLKPGVKYEWRAITEGGAGKIEGEWKSFRSLDPGASSTSFVVWNDTPKEEKKEGKL